MGYYFTSLQDTRLSGVAGLDDHSSGFEAFYNIELTPATHLSLDVQQEDSALPDVDTAVIVGARLNIAF